MPKQQSESIWDDADLIYCYTREQAIEDGVLVDVSEMAREAGFKYPMALTISVWTEVVVPSDEAREIYGQSEEGRLWDIFNVLRYGIRNCAPGTDTLLFTVLVMEDGRLQEIELKSIIGPGDAGEPVMTILKPNED